MSNSIPVYNEIFNTPLNDNSTNGYQLSVIRSQTFIHDSVFHMFFIKYNINGRGYSKFYLPKKFIEKILEDKTDENGIINYEDKSRKMVIKYDILKQVVEISCTSNNKEEKILFPRHIFNILKDRLNMVYVLVFYFKNCNDLNIDEIREMICLALVKKLYLKALSNDFNNVDYNPLQNNDKYVADYLLKENNDSGIVNRYYDYFSKLMNKDLLYKYNC
ncbi:MAG: hypothetical protein QM539_10910 [Alphaproteobacteria bacterium]|nr:hypothetical protein [Alphaproteobacteria bacterium]